MPTCEFQIPTDEETTATATLAYLNKAPDLGNLVYLQAKRSQVGAAVGNAAFGETTATYEAMLGTNVSRLASLISGPFDAVMSPPSRYCDAYPYRNAVLKKGKLIDITSRFSRTMPVRSGEDCTLSELIEATSYIPGGDERCFQTLLIIDDIISTGRSAGALIKHLQLAGLTEPFEITIACPLWCPRGRDVAVSDDAGQRGSQ